MQLIIFTGHRKSGTTLLQSLFDDHKGINLYPADLSILYAYFPKFTSDLNFTKQQLKDRLNYVLTQSLIRNIGNSSKSKKLIEGFISELNKSIPKFDLRSRKDVIDGIFEAWLSSQVNIKKKLPFVFKETSQSIHFNYFKNTFPNLKMLCLIRDPRDNYASIKSGIKSYYSFLGENNNTALSSVINRVKIDLKSAWINQKSYSDSFLSVRYEDLVENPEKYVKKISKFLSLDFSQTMLIPTNLGEKYLGNNFDGEKFNSISQKNVGRWRDRITQKEAKIIEFWLSDYMKLWGYKTQYDPSETQIAFSEFYDWYNSEYFYKDSFKNNKK